VAYATSRKALGKVRGGLLRKWKLRGNAVSASFEEVGRFSQFAGLALEGVADHRHVTIGGPFVRVLRKIAAPPSPAG
jgi:hypothetical protein